MNDAERRTRQTYDNAAQDLAEHFKGIGSRDADIARAFELSGATSKSHVLELGCGDGRDAQDILRRTNHLTAVDYSHALIELAKRNNPEHAECFHTADIRAFEKTSDQYDIIFAFASLLHLTPKDLKMVLNKYLALLSDDGIFYFSTKRSDAYKQVEQEDKFGWRLFHLYSPKETRTMLPNSFKEIYLNEYIHGSTSWFTQAFQRREQ